MDRATKIAAARRYAPPLFSYGPLDRRGARLRQLNRSAVDYAARSGLAFDDVYPNAIHMVRGMAPPAGSREAPAYARAVGLPAREVYPTAAFEGEAPRPAKGRRWGWAAAGAAFGAVLAGPVGLAVGGGLGLLGGGRWG